MFGENSKTKHDMKHALSQPIELSSRDSRRLTLINLKIVEYPWKI